MTALLGQAKLIISFPFQGFQNSMREGGHFSLFVMTEILRKQLKKPHHYSNEYFVNISKSMRCKLPCNENFVVLAKKHAGGNRNLIINFAWP